MASIEYKKLDMGHCRTLWVALNTGKMLDSNWMMYDNENDSSEKSNIYLVSESAL